MSNWRIHQRQSCRVCGEAGPRRFLHFARMPFTDELVTPDRRGQEFVADLDIYWCPACRMAQTLHDVEVGDYYRDYRYTVAASPTARRFMERVAAACFERLGLRAGCRVLEIGSGDGGQLACFRARGARVLGFEPSGELVAAAQGAGIATIAGLFDSATAARIPTDLRPLDAVLLTYTFDHLPAPRAALHAIHDLLAPDGVVILEVHDLAQTLARRETCLFEHEHTVYLHRGAMWRLLQTEGFELLPVELVAERERRGNSLLVAARKAARPPSAEAETTILRGQSESDPPHPLDAWAPYARFAAEVDAAYERLRGYVRAAREAGRRLAGYGAGGRGVMTLAMAELSAAHIAYVSDQNSAFHGLLTPVTHVPVVAPERLRVDRVDEVLVFSYGYLGEIRAGLADVERRGTRFTSLLDLLADRPAGTEGGGP